MSLYLFLKKYRPKYQDLEVKRLVVPSCKTFLDLGCGNGSVISSFRNQIKFSVGMDIYLPDLKESKKNKIHNKYILGNILNADKYFSAKSFDCVMAIGVIEHLKKNQAFRLITKMEKIAKRMVVIVTPNGYVKQEGTDNSNNPYQKHLSGFDVYDFQQLGYQLRGLDGPKFLRQHNAKIKYQPLILFSLISTLLDQPLRFFPSLSFNLLAYKHL